MIGYLKGRTLFSDGSELILLTSAGVGHQIYFYKIYPEGVEVGLYVTHVIRENAQELYGFPSLQEKKMFELLTTVKGIGPKSAYSLLAKLGVDLIINSVRFENKSALSSAPGVGPKAAAQIILDLTQKIEKIRMYITNQNDETKQGEFILKEFLPLDKKEDLPNSNVYSDAILACRELGFSEDKVRPIALKILSGNVVLKAEQLVHLVLKEI